MQQYHQILGLRDYTTSKGEIKKRDTFYEKKWQAVDLKDIFKDPDAFLKSIPTDEHFNLYFTVAECVGRREFRKQKYIPFDIDGIDVTKRKEVVEIALKALGLMWAKTLSIYTGNGVQFFVELKEAFEDPSFFDNERIFYKACCERIDRALKEANLPGDADSSVFSLARLMRFPNTFNIKPDKPKRKSEVLQDTSEPVDFNLQEASGIPKLTREETLAKWPPPDTEAVLAGCENLKMMLAEPDKVPEPLWYANASIVGHLGGNPAEGRRIWQEYSSKYAKYDAKEADRKLDQATAASGPRTCANMSQLPGSKCDKCQHFKKVKSPIMLVGPNYIRTKGQGFHEMNVTQDGKPTLGKPAYDDLLKFFEQTYPYVVNSESGQVYTFSGTEYQPFYNNEIRAFAEKWFQTCNTQKASEFLQKVLRNNLQSPEWFHDTTEGKMNFLNGVLDIKSMKFSEGHAKDQGFMFTLPYNYDPTEKAPRFERFLEEVTEGDQEIRQQLLEFGGYCLSNDEYWEHKALLLVGAGANGKSVYLSALESIAEGAFSSVSMRSLQDAQFIAQLEGKLFNISEEGSTSAFRETDIFKTLTTGGKVTVKTVYQKPYAIQNTAKLVFSCNEIPGSADKAYGFYRRFAIVPFNAVFTKENRDPHLIGKLKAERAGILNLMIEAYQDMKKRGFLMETVKGAEALGEYKEANDPISEWAKDNLEIGPVDENVMIKNSDLYAKYADSCDVERSKAAPKTAFMANLGKHIPNIKLRRKQRWISNENHRVLLGVSFRKEVRENEKF